MNLNEAYSLLGLSSGVSPEDIKKKYRELTRKYHPDINKDEGAEDRFKKINEAYQCAINGKGTDPEPPARVPFNPFQGFGNIPGIHNPFGGTQNIQPVDNIVLNISISFKESVLGCQKELSFARRGKCVNCEGHGFVSLHNGCDKCGGKGQIVGRQGNMIFSRTCDKCMGQNTQSPCNDCKSSGRVDTQVSGNVQVPGGVVSGNILRLNGFGNYAGSFMGGDQYSEAHLHINVEPVENLRLEGQDVVSEIDISLLEALCGCSKPTKTIMGEQYVLLPGLTKNKDEIKIPGLGVNGVGAQRVIVNVSYPDQIDNLINALSDHNLDDLNDED